MQSRILSVAAAITKVARTSSSTWVLPNIKAADLRRGLAWARSGRTADPAVHAGDFDADPVVTTRDSKAAENVAQEKPVDEHMDTEDSRRWGGIEPLSPPKPPYAGSLRLESTGVNKQPLDPTFQQKSRLTTVGGASSLEDLYCAGLDGSPWPKETEKEQRDSEKQQEDDQEYYKHHKASPLSEVKVADTRKPISRATDGTAYSREESGKDATGWRPEQLDTAEESLLRAARIWKKNAMHGDPDAPHSRVLRSLLRERGDSTAE